MLSSAMCVRAFAAFVFVLVLVERDATAAPGRRILKDIPGAQESLLRIVNPKFYKSLQISPVEGWIVVRGQLAAGTHVYGARVAHSELGGVYDKLALDLANNLQVIGYPHIELEDSTPTILVHLLIYQIKDATLAISFAHFDTAGGSQIRYYGCAWMAVQKANHLWETIEPRNLQPNEPRGPRTYTLAVESPIARARLPRAVGYPNFRPR
jgi:hypothetical protein